ncbi:uncharacterized protein [Solanum lycopersicum]|uniref:uncharacterized protein n=1 Tax=Solanum lycopersicum TaxID=4081 RepID=UPI0037481A26
MLVEVNVTKSIPQKITVVDPYGKTFLQDVVLEWKPQYCDKCQKIGHVCQVETGLNEEIMKKRRPGKKVTQTWKYKGPISQKSELEKKEEHRKEEHSQEMRMRAQEEEQISEIVKHQRIMQCRDIRWSTKVLLMKWLFWNMRGINKRYKQKEIKMLIQNKVCLASLVETRVKNNKLSSVLRGIAPGWQVLHNYEDSANGRIWVIWNDNWYEVKKISSSAQMLHCQVNERSKGYQIMLTVVYGLNTAEQRKSLWKDLETLAQGITQSWLIVGDFNAVMYAKDRIVGVPVTSNEIKDFGDCVRDMGLMSCNGMHGKCSFKFFNVWTEYERFMEIVETAWKRHYDYDAMKKVWCKLKDLQHRLQQLNRKEFKYIGKKIEQARIDVANVQNQLNEQATDGLIMKEKELLINLEKWSLIEENALRQKSRIKWIQLGDANNKYFSAVIKERTQKKQVRSTMTLSGQMIYDPQEIQEEFVIFYKSLMGTSAGKLPAVNVKVMKRGPALTQQQRIQLCREVTEQEIFEGLKSIGDDKAPGIDGYNDYFFKHIWKIVKRDVIEGVENFFKTGKLHKEFNCTLVTLIPKVQNPKTVKKSIDQ